jgi:hypothetical protein
MVGSNVGIKKKTGHLAFSCNSRIFSQQLKVETIILYL